MISSGWLSTTSARIPVEFQRAKLGISILLSPSGSLLSLRFASQNLLGLGSSWIPPDYALGSPVRVIEVQVGSGKLRSRGTLTLLRSSPGRQHPCIIMLSGSGPCDQDSSAGCAKPFKDLALGLAALGVATLRFDKITYTHGARFRNSDAFTLEDEYMGHARDAIHQASQHDSISSRGVFVLGHSLGAYVVPRLMAEDTRIAGCIIMAGPAAPLCCTTNETEEEPPQIKDLQRQCELASDPNLSPSTPRSELPFGIGLAYWRSFANFTPIATCVREEVRPVFVLQGERGYQITVEDAFSHWRVALGSCSHAKLKLYEDLSDLFVRGEGQPSSPKEYKEPGNVDGEVLRDVAEWVFGNVR